MWVIIRFFGLLLLWNNWLKFKKKRYEKAASDKHKVDDKEVLVYFEKKFCSEKKTYIGIELKRESFFKIHPETASDRWFKSVGMSTELQTGDSGFDKKVYLESDAPSFVNELGNDVFARETVLSLFKSGVTKIVCEKDWLEVHLDGERRDTDEIQHLLVSFGKWLDLIPSRKYSLFKDPFFFKALSAEFIFTGIAFYAAIEFIRYTFYGLPDIDTHILYSHAIKFTLLSFAILIPFNFSLLKGSSRGHRLILENMFYILLGVPLACFYLVSDANRAWDKSEIANIDLPAETKSLGFSRSWYARRDTFSSRGYRRYRMKIYLSPLGKSGSVSVAIPKRVYMSFPSSVNVDVGQGYFNQRYIKKIRY